MSLDADALAIVEAALDIDDPKARARFVAARCAGVHGLQAKVDHILAMENTQFKLLPTESFIAPSALFDVLPERIGPYRVLEEIARGGMGAVVKAERDDGVFAQTVAIKLIRSDIASPRAKARFADERRILARLIHPAIVRILDGGEQDGYPWLVMDYVDGTPITAALAARAISEDARLDAFEAVCEAVAHAHRNLVIHADIKPSNVLMTKSGTVHLLDFGIARLIVDLDACETGDPYPLTKGYAAPERGVGVPPTIASDVFSLGVLFFEMLTGENLSQDGPFIPETRLPPNRLTGDLQAIAARALHELPQCRYADVAALLSDIRCHRGHIPVAARTDVDWRYRAGKFVRRHRTGLAISAAAIVSLMAATMVSTSQYFRAERARTEADARFADARGTARYLLFDLMPKLENQPGALPLRAEIADVAQRYLDRLAGARQASAAVKLEAATGLWRLAQHQAKAGRPSLGQADRADANLTKAENIVAAMTSNPAKILLARIRLDQVTMAIAMEADAGKAEQRSILAGRSVQAALAFDPQLEFDRLFVMADLRNWQGRFDEAQNFASDALKRRPKDGSRQSLLDQARLTAVTAEAMYYDGDIDRAANLYREALRLIEIAFARWPGDNYILSRRAYSRWELGTTLLALGHHTQGLRVLEQGQIDAERAFAFDRADREAQRRVRVLTAARGQALALLNRNEEAMVIFAAILKTDEAMLRADPSNTRLARDVVYDHSVIGEALDTAGRRDEACTQDRRTLALYDELDRKRVLLKLDVGNNIKLVSEREAKNCE